MRPGDRGFAERAPVTGPPVTGARSALSGTCGSRATLSPSTLTHHAPRVFVGAHVSSPVPAGFVGACG
ncbi:hypothetical protein GCM10027563_12270 [Parasphingorhabdus pacifica]